MEEIIIYKVSDIQKMLGGISYGLACKKIREVKSVSNRLDIKGAIHKLDWDDYLEFRKNFVRKLNEVR